MIIKQYKSKLSNELQVSSLVTTNDSNGSLFFREEDLKIEIESLENNDVIEFEIERLGLRTFLTNTTNIIATDIESNGVLYFYKVQKPSISGYTYEVVSESYSPSGNYIYTNLPTVEILFSSISGNNKFIINYETVPVFVDKRHLNLKHIYESDGKYFVCRIKNSKILVTFSKDILDIKKKNYVFQIDRTRKSDSVYFIINEFIHSGHINKNGVNGIVRYDYFPYQHRLLTENIFTGKIDSENSIFLNKNVDVSSIFLKKINNTSINIDLSKISTHGGKVYFDQLLIENIIDKNDDLEVVYDLLDIDIIEKQIPISAIDGNSKLHTYVSPTSILSNGITTKKEKEFGVIKSRNDFLIDAVFSFSNINIRQSGNEYSYDYLNQSNISFTDGFELHEFYTQNMDDIDYYLNSKLYKSCGVFVLAKSNKEFVSCKFKPKIKENFHDFLEYKIFSNSIVILGNENTDVPAGVGKILIENIYPLNFSIDYDDTDNSYFVNIDISRYEEDISGLLESDPDIIDFCNVSDLIKKDYSYDKNKIKCLFNKDLEINISNNLFFDEDTKALLCKIQKTSGYKLYIKYEDIASSYGI